MRSNIVEVTLEVEVFHDVDEAGKPFITNVEVQTLTPDHVKAYLSNMAQVRWHQLVSQGKLTL